MSVLGALVLAGALAASPPGPDTAQRIIIVRDGAAPAPDTDWSVALGTWFAPPTTVVRGAVAETRAGDLVLLAPSRSRAIASIAADIACVRASGAEALLATPPDRLAFDGTEPRDAAAAHDAALRGLAVREGAVLVDLARRSRDLWRALGPSAAALWFAPDAAAGDAWPRYNARGANAIACLAAGALEDAGLFAPAAFVRDRDCGAPHDALSRRAVNARGPRHARGAALARLQPPPHGGAGSTTAYPYFADAPDLGFHFRKRALHRGASIGLHLHRHDEIYYVLEGEGEGDYTVDGATQRLVAGDAVLVRDGSTHSLAQVGDADLVILIVYPKH